MILEILKAGDPVLRQVAKPISKLTRGLERLAEDMLETLYASEDGVGLAAPQVGISKRIVVIDVGEGPIVLFNPEIIERRGCEKGSEGCLSLPGFVGVVERSETITVGGLSMGGKWLDYRATGWLARVFQHETDHLDGILFTDRATGIGRK